MRLWLIRHAEAVERAAGFDDAARALTPKGRKRWTRQVRGLTRLGVSLERVLHSPWLRALETAELMMPLLDGESAVTPGLAEPPSPALLAALTGDRIALVGHQPWLSELLSLLVLGAPAQAAHFPLAKGGVAHLEGEPVPGGMQLRALFRPKTLMLLGDD